MSNKVKRTVVLGAAIVIGVIGFLVIRTGLRSVIPDSAMLRILISGLAGGLGYGTGLLTHTGLKKMLNVQESGE